jgi:hypothetical protein
MVPAMEPMTAGGELLGIRHIFETWWIGIPVGFDETWVDEGGYWHAWDLTRSVSLSSTVVNDERGRPVPADQLAEAFTGILAGEAVDEGPEGLLGLATTGPADPDARASRVVTGAIAVDGRVLVATITSDDLDWSLAVWRSIQHGPGHGGALPGHAATTRESRARADPPARRRRPGWDRAVH